MVIFGSSLDKSMKYLLGAVLAAKEANTENSRDKLGLYRSFWQEGSATERMIEIVETQQVRFKLLRSWLIESNYREQEYPTNELRTLLDVMIQGEALLNRLIGIFHSQELVLRGDYAVEKKREKFVDLFHDELAIYKEFDADVRHISPGIMNAAQKFAAGKEESIATRYLYVIILCLGLFTAVGFYNQETFKKEIGVSGVVGVTAVMLASEYATKKIRILR
jgi:hypothetical protein